MKTETNCPKCRFQFRIPSDKVIKFACPNCKTNLHAVDGIVYHRLIDKILDRTNGWEYSQREMPIELKFSKQWIPYYEITIGNIVITAYQHDERGASYICCNTVLDGLELLKMKENLIENYQLMGMLSWGITTEDVPTLQAAFPISDDMLVQIARKQLMVTIGQISETAIEIYRNSKPKGFDWNLAGNVAELTGKLLRGFIG